MNHIELFAGCGGLSLGLETAGFDLLMANELSPMASETFAWNHLNADLADEKNMGKVLWISSQHSRENIKSRLRENPMEAVGIDGKHSDLLSLKPTSAQLKRSLLVGSIVDLNSMLLNKKNKWLLESIKALSGNGEIDLISGGPPCQSFSLAGLREHSNDRNQLPAEFAKFVGILKPKLALLENVSGILRAFRVGENKYYAWYEVAKAFCEEGYVPLCLHLNAKYVGVAQNRPRFVLLAFRSDIFKEFVTKVTDDRLTEELNRSREFFESEELRESYGNLDYIDVVKHPSFYDTEMFSYLRTLTDGELHTVEDAIDDLRDEKNSIALSEYVNDMNDGLLNYHNHPVDRMVNHEPRSNNPKVKSRFRIYQVIAQVDNELSKEVIKFMKTEGESAIKESTLKVIAAHWLLDLNGNQILKPTPQFVLEILTNLYTKKQTQRALRADVPAPAALSIPDDACHYYESPETQRTLTVREMARIQSFPDWYQIKSKVTTGGQMRKFEVPQYTQIGNAVPPLLGLQLGLLCKEILNLVGD